MNDQKMAAISMSLITTLLLISGLLAQVAAAYHPVVDMSGFRDLYVWPPEQFRPEPLERLLFVTGIFTLPIILFGTFYGYSRIFSRLPPRSVRFCASGASLVLTAAGIVFTGYVFSSNRYYLVGTIGTGFQALSCVALAGIGCIWLMKPSDSRMMMRCCRVLEISASATALGAGIMAPLLCIFGIESINSTSNYLSHFNAVFHAVVQVHLGRQLLTDLGSQYGLFPHFMEPVFRVSGLSVLSFTVMMALLMAAAYIAMYSAMRRTVANLTLCSLGFVAVVYAGYLRGTVYYQPENYFQYHPIRFLFPAVSLYLVQRYLTGAQHRWYPVMFIFSSLAVLWNPDTGIITLLSWLLLLIYNECAGFRVAAIARHIVKAALFFSAVAGTYAGVQYLTYGSFPDFAAFLNYQKLFYVSGFFMIPMPLWHPWNLVALVYTAGLLHSLSLLVERRVTPRSGLIFYLSVLGFGLLSYYQGRSHDDCLIGPSYPAVILITIYADTLLARVHQKRFPGERPALIFLVSLLLFCTASFVNEAPGIASFIATRVTAPAKKESTYLKRTVDSIRNNVSNGEEALLLSYHSGILSLATGTPCPVQVAGPSEMVLVSDCNKISGYLDSKGKKVFVDEVFLREFSGNPNACSAIARILEQKFSINYVAPVVWPGETDAYTIYMMTRK